MLSVASWGRLALHGYGRAALPPLLRIVNLCKARLGEAAEVLPCDRPTTGKSSVEDARATGVVAPGRPIAMSGMLLGERAWTWVGWAQPQLARPINC